VLLSQQGTHPLAILALADGTVFHGNSIGAAGSTTGEVVFNTAITGYQEILTDPSYCQQIVTLTYPHIGNYGVNSEDVEAEKVHAAGLIIKDLPLIASNFRSTMTLAQYLAREGTVAIANIDTRKLTRLLRSKGAQNGCIIGLAAGETVTPEVIERALAGARSAPNMAGLDLAKVVSVKERYEWTQTEWQLGSGYGTQTEPKFHVVAFDFGVKKNILRMLASRGCRITVVPAQTSAADVKKLNPETFKMKFGHHGANHPVKDLDNGRVSITSQNHGFAVDEKSLPANLRPTHISLFDNTLQGLARTDKPAFCFQGHPEASPGPHDIGYLFDRFTALMEKH
jgi:carbamoyl-phosphate synthase small subunit